MKLPLAVCQEILNFKIDFSSQWAHSNKLHTFIFVGCKSVVQQVSVMPMTSYRHQEAKAWKKVTESPESPQLMSELSTSCGVSAHKF
jgi:hypothetical protein